MVQSSEDNVRIAKSTQGRGENSVRNAHGRGGSGVRTCEDRVGVVLGLKGKKYQ